MTYQQITKYYYHYYVLISLFFFSISAASYIFWGDFSPTSTVKIVALIIATSLYALLLLYFLYLEKNQEWIIPRQWKRVHESPRLYALVIFPLLIITVLWFNLAGTLPMVWTYDWKASNRGKISNCSKKTLQKYYFLFVSNNLFRYSYFQIYIKRI
jgi:heme/copper-type cytochrome/quinol oxidase subunit 4